MWCEIGVYHVPLALKCIYGRSGEGIENEDGEEVSEISRRGDCLASCMQMTWFCVVGRRKT